MAELAKIGSDEKLIELWLHGRPDTTAQTYRRTVKAFQKTVNKPLQETTLEDLQRYATSLESLKESSRRTKINSIKSLFTFAAKLQYTRFNVAAALRLPKAKRTLAGRILTRDQVQKLFAVEDQRDRAFLRLLYATGIRISEACGLVWGDFNLRHDGAIQAKILGKGNKERVVIVPGIIWAELLQLRENRPDNEPVFGFSRTTAHRIVKDAAVRAGLPKVSAHWFRHAHCFHSLAGGAPLQLVRDSLGHSSIAVTNVYLESMPDDSSSNYLSL